MLTRRTFLSSSAAASVATLLNRAGKAQPADLQFAQTMHDKIPLYGTQGDDALVVPAGENVEVTGERSELDILVYGTLRVMPGASLSFRTLTAVDGGTIELHEPCTLTVRDMPFNLEMDPSQYGHGLLVVNGTIRTVAPSWRQAFCQLGGEARAGDVTLTLAAVPTGWRAGDTLIVPDTRQPTTGADLSAQTERVTIASIDGETVTLTAPLAYDHLGHRNQDGSVSRLPDIAAITQPIVIRSEHPDGVRGHVFVTAASHQDVEGVALVGMGRTTTAKLHSTARDDQGNLVQIGTNQIGRYAWHHHHLLGKRANGLPYQFRFEHCAIDGSPKWGVAVHGSHFGIVNDCAVYNAAGCGIVTEDPWVYGNKITNNIVIAKQAGSGLRISNSDQQGGRSHPTDPAGDFWHNRGGFGFSSAMNETTGNRAYCCTESFGMAGCFGGGIVLYKPKVRGICTCGGKTDPNAEIMPHMGYTGEPKRYPFVFPTTGNLAWGGWRPWESWFADTHQGYEKMFPGFTAVHCRQPVEIWDHFETVFDGWKVLGDFKQISATGDPKTVALFFKKDYRFGITVNDCEFRGYDAAYSLINDQLYTSFNRCKFECPLVNWLPFGRFCFNNQACDMNWTECEFLKVNNRLEFAKTVTYQYQGQTVEKYPLVQPNNSNRWSLKPIRYFIRPWVDGFEYRMFHDEQRADYAAPPIAADKAYNEWPKGVNTNAQLVGLGTPIYGEVMPTGAVRTGWYWYAKEDCCETVLRLRKRIEELKNDQ
jgi:hypothetical protein